MSSLLPSKFSRNLFLSSIRVQVGAIVRERRRKSVRRARKKDRSLIYLRCFVDQTLDCHRIVYRVYFRPRFTRKRERGRVVSIKSIDGQVLQITAEHGTEAAATTRTEQRRRVEFSRSFSVDTCPRERGGEAGAGCRRVKSREDKSRLIQNAYREKSRARIYRSVAIPASCAVPVPPSRFARARLVTSRYTGKSGM